MINQSVICSINVESTIREYILISIFQFSFSRMTGSLCNVVSMRTLVIGNNLVIFCTFASHDCVSVVLPVISKVFLELPLLIIFGEGSITFVV